MKYLELNKALNDVYSNNPLVNSVYDNSNKINQKGTKYWAIAYDIQNIVEYEDYTTYNYNIFAVERMDDAQEMINEHYDTGMRILKDGFSGLEANYDVSVQHPITYQMNSIRFADVNDVVMANVSITAENSDCD